MTDIINSVFTDVVWNNVTPARAPEEVNGAGVSLDLNTPTDHVSKVAKFVVNDANDISLRHTIAYVLAIANDNPQATDNENLSDDVILSAASWVGANVIRREFHQIFHKLAVSMTFRQTDVIPVARLDAVLNGNLNYYLDQADRLWGHIAGSDGGIEKITTYRQEAGKAIIANANHRELEENHNWYTNNQNIEGTSTCRLLSCGGSGIDRFRAYMGIYGHDMWHYMDNDTIRKCAHMLAGGVCERVNPGVDADGDPFHSYTDENGNTDLDNYGHYVRDSTGMNYRPNGPVYLENFRIGNVQHQKVPIDRVIDIGQAARDRFPGNMVGIAGLITGVQAVISMLSSVSSVVVLDDVDILIANYNELLNKFTSPGMSRSALLGLKDALQGAISFAYGYCSESPELRDQAGKYSSLVSYANRSAEAMNRGSIFARRMREIATDPNAVESLIEVTFANMANAITRAVHVEDFDVPMGAIRTVETPSVRVYRNADQIATEKARREAADELAEM